MKRYAVNRVNLHQTIKPKTKDVKKIASLKAKTAKKKSMKGTSKNSVYCDIIAVRKQDVGYTG